MDSAIVFQSDNWTVREIFTKQAAVEFGRREWCTGREESQYYETSYAAKYGRLFTFHKHTKPRPQYQLFKAKLPMLWRGEIEFRNGGNARAYTQDVADEFPELLPFFVSMEIKLSKKPDHDLVFGSFFGGFRGRNPCLQQIPRDETLRFLDVEARSHRFYEAWARVIFGLDHRWMVREEPSNAHPCPGYFGPGRGRRRPATEQWQTTHRTVIPQGHKETRPSKLIEKMVAKMTGRLYVEVTIDPGVMTGAIGTVEGFRVIESQLMDESSSIKNQEGNNES